LGKEFFFFFDNLLVISKQKGLKNTASVIHVCIINDYQIILCKKKTGT